MEMVCPDEERVTGWRQWRVWCGVVRDERLWARGTHHATCLRVHSPKVEALHKGFVCASTQSSEAA